MLKRGTVYIYYFFTQKLSTKANVNVQTCVNLADENPDQLGASKRIIRFDCVYLAVSIILTQNISIISFHTLYNSDIPSFASAKDEPS